MSQRKPNKVTSIKRWIAKTAKPARGLLVPISGGSDSALAFYLASLAYPGKTVGIYIGDDLRCRSWFESKGQVRVLPASILHGSSNHPSAASAAAGELDLEVSRWAHFQSIALAERLWLVGTRNRTEEVLGSYSLASRVATMLPLSSLWKSEVMGLCEELGVPSAITASSRRADPACGRPKELAEIPLELIDIFLRVQVKELPRKELAKLTPAQVEYLKGIFDYNRFKDNLPLRCSTYQTR